MIQLLIFLLIQPFLAGINYDGFFWYCRYVGFYKGIQSAGAAVAWQIDTHKVSYMKQLIVNWVLTTASYPLLVLLVIKAIKDEDEDEDGVEDEVEDGESQTHKDKILTVD